MNNGGHHTQRMVYNCETITGLGVSRETSRRLEQLCQLVRIWNQHSCLVASHDLADLDRRHIADCCQLAAFIPANVTEAIDLGSGAGFPGLVLAIVTGLSFTLVEANRRKAAFLQEAIRQTGASAIVHAMRIEVMRLRPTSLVTARAVAPLPKLLALAHPVLAADGIALFPKGARVEAELTEAQRHWTMRVERFPSRTTPEATILRISELRCARPSTL